MSSFSPLSADDIAVNTIRTLAADVVGKANSGHPVSKHRHPLLNSPPCFLSLRSVPHFLMYLFLTSGCPYGNGTGGPRPIHKVRHLPDIPLIVRLPLRVLTNRALRSGSSTPILRVPNGSIGTVSFCRTGKRSAQFYLPICVLIANLNSHG